ncbi:MAG: hypothetical protein Q7V62_16130, partial [Actinomycetota bacterium]|nr:hypothetical protein [Actinomycetota bacterium]
MQIRCDCKGSYYGQYCDALCVDGDYDDTQRACICNRRAGVRGAACNEPICAGNGAGKWVNGDPLGARPFETDEQVGACECSAPWTLPECRTHTCNTNPLGRIEGWTREFGHPVNSSTGLWSCACNYPFVIALDEAFNLTLAGINGTNLTVEARRELSKPYNCAAYNCGFGTPLATATLDTPLVDLCVCDPTLRNIGIRTNESLCHDGECAKPCGYANCGVDPEVFGFTELGSVNGAPCCNCPPNLGFNISGVCLPRCAYYQPCLQSDVSSFVSVGLDSTTDTIALGTNATYAYNREITKWECVCNAYRRSVSNDTNDCSIYEPPPVVPYPPINDPGFIVPLVVDSSSSTIVGGLSDAAFIGLLSAGSFMLLAGAASLWLGTGAATTASAVGSGAAAVAKTTTTTTVTTVRTGARARAGEKARLLSVTLLCLFSVAIVRVESFRYPHTRAWNKRAVPAYYEFLAGDGYSESGKAVEFLVDMFGGPLGVHDNCVNRLGVNLIANPAPAFRFVPNGDLATEIAIDSLDVCEFDTENAAGARIAERMGIARNQIKWMHLRLRNQGLRFWAGVNICGDDLRCGGHGTCTSYLGSSASNLVRPQPSDSTKGFYRAPFGYEHRQPIFASTNAYYQHRNYNILGCVCNDDRFGLQCEFACPTGAGLCSNHGTCDGGHASAVTDRVPNGGTEQCTCTGSVHPGGGCLCAEGYEGTWCERAVQTNKYAAIMQLFQCCPPWAGADCAPMRDSFVTGTTCEPVRTFTNATRADCSTATTGVIYDTRLPIPSVCGDAEPLTTFYTGADGSRITTTRGECGVDATADAIDPSLLNDPAFYALTDGQRNALADRYRIQARCLCNPGAREEYTLANGAVVRAVEKRRGWYGPQCGTRTCTRQAIPTLNVDGTANAATEDRVVPEQCSGNAHPTLHTGKETNGSDPFLNTVCLDERKYGFNTPGRCAKCRDGWGAFSGLAAVDLVGTPYAAYDTGLCAVQTFKNNAGSVCGGYGDARAVWSVRVFPDPSIERIAGRVVAGQDGRGCDCPLGTVRYVDTTVTPPRDTGICQRTCVTATETVLVATDYDAETGLFAGARAMQLQSGCGGTAVGLCRPIVDGPWDASGFNSACLCRAGFMGHDCSERDPRFFDRGFENKPGANDLVCGEYGTPQFPEFADTPAGITAD